MNLTLNLLLDKEPQCCDRQYYPQRLFIDTSFDGQLPNVKLSSCF